MNKHKSRERERRPCHNPFDIDRFFKCALVVYSFKSLARKKEIKPQGGNRKEDGKKKENNKAKSIQLTELEREKYRHTH